MNSNHAALVVEDNAALARLVQLHLEDLDLDSDIASDGLAAVSMFNNGSYGLVVLDIMLPELDGLEVCRRIRASDQRVPILMLTARSEEIDKVVGLEVGADDYLTKPFGVAEFTARIKALLRRAGPITSEPSNISSDDSSRITQGNIHIDLERRTVRLKDRTVDLTAKEFDLICYFARRPGHVFTRSELLEQVWGYRNGVYQHTVNSHINRLRAKIEIDPANPQYIVTVWGVGYKLAEQQGV